MNIAHETLLRTRLAMGIEHCSSSTGAVEKRTNPAPVWTTAPDVYAPIQADVSAAAERTD
jgi:hypothetical protein